MGFVRGQSSACVFWHPEWKLISSVHGDDFTTAGPKGSLDLFKLLLEQKAAPEAKDDYGWTPMFWASLEGKLNILE